MPPVHFTFRHSFSPLASLFLSTFMPQVSLEQISVSMPAPPPKRGQTAQDMAHRGLSGSRPSPPAGSGTPAADPPASITIARAEYSVAMPNFAQPPQARPARSPFSV